jgi:hypothetical protein
MLSNYKIGEVEFIDGIVFCGISLYFTKKSSCWLESKCLCELQQEDCPVDCKNYMSKIYYQKLFGTIIPKYKIVDTKKAFITRYETEYLLWSSPSILTKVLYTNHYCDGYKILIPYNASREEFTSFLSKHFEGPFDLSLYYASEQSVIKSF